MSIVQLVDDIIAGIKSEFETCQIPTCVEWGLSNTVDCCAQTRIQFNWVGTQVLEGGQERPLSRKSCSLQTLFMFDVRVHDCLPKDAATPCGVYDTAAKEHLLHVGMVTDRLISEFGIRKVKWQLESLQNVTSEGGCATSTIPIVLESCYPTCEGENNG